jgi:hypothetical protein
MLAQFLSYGNNSKQKQYYGGVKEANLTKCIQEFVAIT